MRGSRPSEPRVRWKAAENKTWRWYERETLIDGQWKLSGITTPVHRGTGQPYTGRRGYLDERLVPVSVRKGARTHGEDASPKTDASAGPTQPDAARRARGGRPPSKWLRSLNADEIRIWLKTIEVPPVGVDGMTFWTHLTRDHFFDAKRIEGLTVEEQAKLHSAAHYGY